jgi:hypothetical protein
LQRGGELGGLEFFAREKNFRGIEAELGVVARGHGPLAFAAGLQLGAEADHRFHAGLGGDADDVVELGELFDHDDDLLAQLAAEEGEADVIVILVAVADDQALRALVHREGDHELRLGAGLKAVGVVLAGGDDLVDDLAQLVDLDGEDAAVGAGVALLLDGLPEHLVELGDAVAEQVLEADDHRGLEAHLQGLVHDIKHADAAAVGQWLDIDAKPSGSTAKWPEPQRLNP